MANIHTIIFKRNSVYNSIQIDNLSVAEKEELVKKWAEKGTRCIIEGFNDKNLHCSHEV